MNIYHIPENEQKMDEIYAIISSDDKGEGIVSMMTPQGGGLPMVFGHKRMLDMIMPLVKKMSKETGKKLLLVKYIKHEVLEEVTPEK